MANTRIQQVTNTERTPEYDVTTEVEVTPEEESKSTSLSMPTDPALLQELQRQIQAAQRTHWCRADFRGGLLEHHLAPGRGFAGKQAVHQENRQVYP